MGQPSNQEGDIEMKFKLINGTYTDEKGRKYSTRKGDHPIVTSDKALDRTFLNCFERVHTDDETEMKSSTVSSTLGEDNDKAEIEPLGGVPPVPSVKDAVGADDADSEDDQGHDSGDSDSDEEVDMSKPVISLKAERRGKNKYDVVKVIDGKITEEAINEEYVSKKEAIAMVKEGLNPKPKKKKKKKTTDEKKSRRRE